MGQRTIEILQMNDTKYSITTEIKPHDIVVDRMAIRAIMNYTKGVENDKRNIQSR